MRICHYTVLGVPKTASRKQIRSAFGELAKKYHPDRLTSKKLSKEEMNSSNMKFREVREAYRILGDESLRKLYDKGGVELSDIDARDLRGANSANRSSRMYGDDSRRVR